MGILLTLLLYRVLLDIVTILGITGYQGVTSGTTCSNRNACMVAHVIPS